MHLFILPTLKMHTHTHTHMGVLQKIHGTGTDHLRKIRQSTVPVVSLNFKFSLSLRHNIYIYIRSLHRQILFLYFLLLLLFVFERSMNVREFLNSHQCYSKIHGSMDPSSSLFPYGAIFLLFFYICWIIAVKYKI